VLSRSPGSSSARHSTVSTSRTFINTQAFAAFALDMAKQDQISVPIRMGQIGSRHNVVSGSGTSPERHEERS
jgi:hypothetical protein